MSPPKSKYLNGVADTSSIPFVWLPSWCFLKHTSKYFSEAAGKYELAARELALVVLKPSLYQMLRNLPSMWSKSKHLSLHSFSEVPALVVTTWPGQDLQVCVYKKLCDLLWLPLSLPSPTPSELLPGEVNTASYSLQKHFQKSTWRRISAGCGDSCCSISFSLTQGWQCSTTICKSCDFSSSFAILKIFIGISSQFKDFTLYSVL